MGITAALGAEATGDIPELGNCGHSGDCPVGAEQLQGWGKGLPASGS